MSNEWSRSELIIAMEFYYKCPEKMHTDAHEKCKEVAALLGRTPGALDRIIRNIKYVATGGTGLAHASSSIFKLAEEFKHNRDKLFSEAASIRRSKNWSPIDCSD